MDHSALNERVRNLLDYHYKGSEEEEKIEKQKFIQLARAEVATVIGASKLSQATPGDDEKFNKLKNEFQKIRAEGRMESLSEIITKRSINKILDKNHFSQLEKIAENPDYSSFPKNKIQEIFDILSDLVKVERNNIFRDIELRKREKAAIIREYLDPKIFNDRVKGKSNSTLSVYYEKAIKSNPQLEKEIETSMEERAKNRFERDFYFQQIFENLKSIPEDGSLKDKLAEIQKSYDNLNKEIEKGFNQSEENKLKLIKSESSHLNDPKLLNGGFPELSQN